MPEPTTLWHVKNEDLPYIALVPEVHVLDQQPLWTCLYDLDRNRLGAPVECEQPPISKVAQPDRLKNLLSAVRVCGIPERVPEDRDGGELVGFILNGAKVPEELVVVGASMLDPGLGNHVRGA